MNKKKTNQDVQEEKVYESPAVIYEAEIQTRAGNASGGILLDPSIDVEGIFND